jgi:hypothetical protein
MIGNPIEALVSLKKKRRTSGVGALNEFIKIMSVLLISHLLVARAVKEKEKLSPPLIM